MHPSVRIQPLVSYSPFIIHIYGPPRIPLPYTPQWQQVLVFQTQIPKNSHAFHALWENSV
jgi:hypothetical protein